MLVPFFYFLYCNILRVTHPVFLILFSIKNKKVLVCIPSKAVNTICLYQDLYANNVTGMQEPSITNVMGSCTTGVYVMSAEEKRLRKNHKERLGKRWVTRKKLLVIYADSKAYIHHK
jgi:hypothetical protein